MREATKNMLIGTFVLLACALVIGMIFFLKPRIGDEKQTLYARFSNINRITVGTRVLFAGKPVGEVTAIKEIPYARDEPTDVLGRVYFYQLTLKIDSGVKVYTCDEISLQTSGLLGEKSVAIIPKAPPKGVVPRLITDQSPFYANSVDPIENSFNDLSSLATEMEGTFRLVTQWIEQHGEELAGSIVSFGDVMDEMKTTVAEINADHLVNEVTEATKNFSQVMCQIDNAMEQLDRGAVFSNIGDLVAHLKTSSEAVEEITQKIASGTGTIGRLVKSDDLYLQSSAILSKADTMMNDINHYGILFHLNKNWQRTRTQRMDLLNSLATPDQFKSYFEREVSQINTAMCRLSLLMNREDFDNERFKDDFAELLRQSIQLSDNLRLYNEQLNSKQNAKGAGS